MSATLGPYCNLQSIESQPVVLETFRTAMEYSQEYVIILSLRHKYTWEDQNVRKKHLKPRLMVSSILLKWAFILLGYENIWECVGLRYAWVVRVGYLRNVKVCVYVREYKWFKIFIDQCDRSLCINISTLLYLVLLLNICIFYCIWLCDMCSLYLITTAF